MKVQPKFDHQNFARIDELLSAIHYKGISLTGVPANFLKDTFITTPYYSNIKNLFINIISRARLRYFKRFHSSNETRADSLPYLFSFCDQSARLMDFAIPVINKLGAEKCLVTTPVKGIPIGINQNRYQPFPYITSKIYTTWRNEYKATASMVKSTIKQIRKEKNISLTAAIEIENNAMYQTLLFETALDFLNKTKPKTIVCDSDRQPANCALVMAGNKLDIPTFTFIHGAIDPPDNYIPILARFVFCWGTDHVEALGKVNTPANKMIVTGNTKLTRSLGVNATTVRKKLNLPATDHLKTIILFTNNIDPALQIQLAQSFIHFCKNNSNVRGMIKLHPLESPADYSALTFPENIRMFTTTEITLDEALAVADGVLSHNSLVAVDTLIKHKPLAILHTINLALGIAERLHQEAGVPLISNQEKFDRFIQSLEKNTYSFELKEKFVHHYCAAFGPEAVDNTIHAIHLKNEKNTL